MTERTEQRINTLWQYIGKGRLPAARRLMNDTPTLAPDIIATALLEVTAGNLDPASLLLDALPSGKDVQPIHLLFRAYSGDRTGSPQSSSAAELHALAITHAMQQQSVEMHCAFLEALDTTAAAARPAIAIDAVEFSILLGSTVLLPVYLDSTTNEYRRIYQELLWGTDSSPSVTEALDEKAGMKTTGEARLLMLRAELSMEQNKQAALDVVHGLRTAGWYEADALLRARILLIEHQLGRTTADQLAGEFARLPAGVQSTVTEPFELAAAREGIKRGSLEGARRLIAELGSKQATRFSLNWRRHPLLYSRFFEDYLLETTQTDKLEMAFDAIQIAAAREILQAGQQPLAHQSKQQLNALLKRTRGSGRRALAPLVLQVVSGQSRVRPLRSTDLKKSLERIK